jgi:hypothetical protein
MVGLAGFEPAITWVLESIILFPSHVAYFATKLRINQVNLGIIVDHTDHILYLAHNPSYLCEKKGNPILIFRLDYNR